MPDIFDSSAHILHKQTEESTRNMKKNGPHSKSTESTETDGKENRKSRTINDYSETMRSEQPSRYAFSAYNPKPENVTFSSQASSEKVILLLRQHPITQLNWIFLAIIMAFVPVLFGSVSVFSELLPVRFQLAAAVGWYLLVIGFVLESVLKWFYNVYIVTDERIIDIDFHSLIYKNVSAAKIDNIEDTTASSGGFFAALFDYGKVTIQTAAEKREFEFDKVPHPTRVTSLINELMLEEEREKLEGRVS